LNRRERRISNAFRVCQGLSDIFLHLVSAAFVTHMKNHSDWPSTQEMKLLWEL